MDDRAYLTIISHYESCLAKFGDSHLGVDWPCQADAELRYQVMLEVIKHNPSGKISLLDFGCGASHLYEFILRHQSSADTLYSHIEYSGLDISPEFIELSREKFPTITYYCTDVLREQADLPGFDYIVMNGVFTEKCNLAYDQMFAYFQAVIRVVFGKSRIGIAFNLMSKQVDWERDDLFHVPFDNVAKFLTSDISRKFVLRHDYGLYEYTTYVYK